jgi:hypothetical protein
MDAIPRNEIPPNDLGRRNSEGGGRNVLSRKTDTLGHQVCHLLARRFLMSKVTDGVGAKLPIPFFDDRIERCPRGTGALEKASPRSWSATFLYRRVSTGYSAALKYFK